MQNQDQPNKPIRQLVTRRELRRFACGCSSTRIESFWQAASENDACQAHQGILEHSSISFGYGERRGARDGE